MPGTIEAPSTSFVPATDDHDSVMVVTYRGVTVSITLRNRDFAEATDRNPDTVVVLIDTDPARELLPLSVQINDDPTWEGEIR